MFRRLSALVAALLFLTASAEAQTLGNLVNDFGNYTFRSSGSVASGAQTVTIQGNAQATTPGGKSFRPIATNVPLLIDQENSGSSETVTPSAVTCSANDQVCTFTATFSNAHSGNFSVRSGTFGLCEAINATTGTGVVFIGNPWRGSTSTITSATLGGACDSTSVDVVDARSGGLVTYSSNGTVYSGGAGTVAGTGITGVERASKNVQTTVITVTATPYSVTNGVEYGGTKIYDFPEGRILVLGVTASLAETTTSTIASTINQTSDFDWSIGTAVASATALSGTMVDLAPKVDAATSATINVAAATFTSALAASAQFDGTATAKDAYLNYAFPTTTDVDADGTMTISGTITITWVQLGDF